MKSTKDKLAKKLGYISTDEHAAIIRKLNDDHRRMFQRATNQTEAEREVNVKQIVDAINGTRFVRVMVSAPNFDVISSDFSLPEFSEVKKIYPPNPEYVTLSAKIDIAGMQRIYSDLERLPMELEYFVHNFMRTFEDRIKTAMSMTGLY